MPFAPLGAGLTFQGMSLIEPPVIVGEYWDVMLFDSVTEAEAYLEPWDVTDGDSRRYDAEGRLLKIEADGSGVRVRAAEESPGHAGELEDLLRRFLERVGEPAEPAEPGCSLSSLVAACDRYRVETPESFSAVLFQLFDDLWRYFRGRELRRGGR